MNRVAIWRGTFIVLLGTLIPVLSGILTYHNNTPETIFFTTIYFIVVYAASWSSSKVILQNFRQHFPLYDKPFLKMALLCLISTIVTVVVISGGTFAWLRLTHHYTSVQDLEVPVSLSVMAAVWFTIIFEVAYLSHEREVDIRTVRQLDRKKNKAEMQALMNELDPHFMFNSLATLSFLILDHPQNAYLFNNRLAQVYKYFLVNKQKNLVPLEEELDFIEDYVFLLQLRHGNKLGLELHFDREAIGQHFIPPGALQIPIENAIKHNELSEDHPLVVQILLKDGRITVTNQIQPKPYPVGSTHIGLNNLRRRYWLACKEKIEVLQKETEFIVALPLIQA